MGTKWVWNEKLQDYEWITHESDMTGIGAIFQGIGMFRGPKPTGTPAGPSSMVGMGPGMGAGIGGVKGTNLDSKEVLFISMGRANAFLTIQKAQWAAYSYVLAPVAASMGSTFSVTDAALHDGNIVEAWYQGAVGGRNARAILDLIQEAKLERFDINDLKARRPEWTRHVFRTGLDELLSVDLLFSPARTRPRKYVLNAAAALSATTARIRLCGARSTLAAEVLRKYPVSKIGRGDRICSVVKVSGQRFLKS